MQPSSTSLTATLPVSNQPAIEFQEVRLGFAGHEILRGVTFSAQERETIILLGETGSGKTLLLKLAAGLLRPDDGRIFILGKDVSAMHERDLLKCAARSALFFRKALCSTPSPSAKTWLTVCMKIGFPKRRSTPGFRKCCGSSNCRILARCSPPSFPAACGGAFRSPAR